MARFSNLHAPSLSIKEGLKWLVRLFPDADRESLLPPPEGFVYPAPPPLFNPAEPYAIWIGHSTFLLHLNGLHILTDPVWESYCSPIRLPAFRRQTAPPLFLSDLPRIDLVLISHNHYDHLDTRTVHAISRFHPEAHWCVPERLSFWFRRKKIGNVQELRWWEKRPFGSVEVTAVPAQHFSGRTLFDANWTHWNGYVIEGSKRAYFAGDTGYNPVDFRTIGSRFSHMDLSLLPIGAYEPRQILRSVHLSPADAVLVHQDVRSRLSIAMHWNTFRLSDEHFERPPYELFLAMQKHGLDTSTFFPVAMGAPINW